MIPDRPLSHWLALAFLVLAWGSSFALTKIAVLSVAPIWMPAARITIAAMILIIALKARGGVVPRGLTNWVWFLWLGATGTMLPFFLISWASLYAPSSLVGILMATNPLIVLVLVHLFLPDEPVRPRHVGGFAVAQHSRPSVARYRPDRQIGRNAGRHGAVCHWHRDPDRTVRIAVGDA
jgi:drug/metabolite transporter (DMT)-like permease